MSADRENPENPENQENVSNDVPPFTLAEREFIARAKSVLEAPSLAMKLATTMGKPLEMLMKKIPSSIQQKLTKTTEKALEKTLREAMKKVMKITEKIQKGNQQSGEKGLEQISKRNFHDRMGHNGLVALTGACGGLFGLPGFLLEVPVTTSLLMHSILQQGANYAAFSNEELVLESLYVLSFSSADKSSYMTSRLAFQYLIREATKIAAGKGVQGILKELEKGMSGVVLKLLLKVAQRFEISLSEEFLAGSVPVIGAVGGATLNVVFLDYYTSIAHYHFGIKYLESRYGPEKVQGYYRQI